MADINDLVERFRTELLREERQAAGRMTRAYGKAWQRIQANLDRLDREYRAAKGERPTWSWIYEHNRMRAFRQQVEAELARFAAYAEEAVSAEQMAAIKEAAKQGKRLAQAAGIQAGWDVFDREAVEATVGLTQLTSPLHELFLKISSEGAQAAEDVLTEGMLLGQGPRQVARQMRDVLGVSLTRALTIARTETLRAHRLATQASYQANSDLISGWTWHASTDERTCGCCWAMHGTEHTLEEELDGHPNCFPAGVVVSGSQVVGATARWFDGEIVEIETIGGRFLTVTPNHPILTPEGWVAAGALHEGSYIIGCRDAERVARSVDPNNYQIPAVIEHVVDSFGQSLGVTSVSVPTSSKDFHGDGGGSKVSIVWANCLLGNGFNTTFVEPDLQQLLCWRHAEAAHLPCDGTAAKLFNGLTPTSNSLVGGLGIDSALLGGAGLSKQTVSLSSAARLDTLIAEESSNGVAGNAVARAQAILGLIGLVECDQVVRVKRNPFRGHVYNLQTTTGWYIANNIITHNCRCAMVPIIKGVSFEVVPGEQRFAELPASEQIKILGPSKWATWKDGKLSFDEDPITGIVGRSYDPRWGWMRYERSLKEMGIDWRLYTARGNLKMQNIMAGKFTEEQLVEIGRKLTLELQAITGLEQRWSGTIELLSRREAPRFWGAKVPTCEILLRTDAHLSTLVHELLHGMSVGLTVPMYVKYIGFEEGVVESLQRILGPSALAKIGQTPVVGLVSYNSYIHQLERLRRWTRLGSEEFYLRMIRTPLANRVQLSRQMLMEAGYTEQAAKGLVTKVLNIMIAE